MAKMPEKKTKTRDVKISERDILDATTIMILAKSYPYYEEDLTRYPELTDSQLFLIRYDWASYQALNAPYRSISPGIRKYIAQEGARVRKERSAYKKKSPQTKIQKKFFASFEPRDYWHSVIQRLSPIQRGLYAVDGQSIVDPTEEVGT